MSYPRLVSEAEATLAPPDDQTIADEREARLIQVVCEYKMAIQAGQKPNRRQLMAQNPDIATELSACLAGLQFVNSAAAGLEPSSSAAISPIDAADLANGQTLGDFKLVRELGRGGMGVVYEAVQISLNREVALKVLPLAAALDARHLQRFRNEAQAAAQLHHTNIVPVYFVGCERSVHFYAMQLIQGQTLAQVISEIREGTFSPSPWVQGEGEKTTPSVLTLRNERRQDYFRAVAKLGIQAADGLDYAHRVGVVHRDIKPSNLMLDIKGNVWITDFGLAHICAGNNLTQEGDLVGTLRYMSPEQATGKAGVVLDQRTDVYSLGITLYELLTLERALPGETREQLLSQIGLHEPRPPRSIDKLIPRELEIILAKATAKEPQDRYQTAGAMAADFRRFLVDEPILARSPSLADKAVKWTRRHRSMAISTLAALLLLAMGLAVSTVWVARQEHLTQAALDQEHASLLETQQQREIADTERQRATKSETQAREQERLAQAALDREHASLLETQKQREIADTERQRATKSEALAQDQEHLTQAALDREHASLLEAKQQREAADTERQRATKSATQAREAVDYLSRVAAEDLADQPQSVMVRKEMLEAALDFYRGLIETGNKDAAAAADLAAAQAHVQAILSALSAFDAFVQASIRTRLLAEPDVAKAISLTTAQSVQIPRNVAPLGDEAASRRELRQMNDAQQKKYYGDWAMKIDTAAKKVLADAQYRRLVEISRQVRSPSTFNDDDVVLALKLTSDQKEAIRKIQSEFRANLRREALLHDGPAERDLLRLAARNVRQAAMAKAVALLNGDQQSAWKQLAGEPFNGTIRDSEILGIGTQHGADQNGLNLPPDQAVPPSGGWPSSSGGGPSSGSGPASSGAGPSSGNTPSTGNGPSSGSVPPSSGGSSAGGGPPSGGGPSNGGGPSGGGGHGRGK